MSGEMKECCLSGYLNTSSTPVGKDEVVNGLPCYVSPTKDGSKAKTIVFIPDIFGYKLPNVRLLADEYAKAGIYAYVPDFFEGDPLPHDFLQSVEPPLEKREKLTVVEKAKNTATVASTLGPWAIKHREAVSRPIIEKFFKETKATSGVGKVGAIGFCWGGRYAILSVHSEGGFADAAVSCHPAMLGIPADIDPVAKPLSLAVGDEDSLLDKKSVGQIVDILAKKTEIPHEVRIYEDQVHGFSLRGDWSSEKDQKSMDETTKQGIDWLTKYL